MAIGIQDQYFGTEIEMTGITRQRAAEKVAELFGTRAVCDGGHSRKLLAISRFTVLVHRTVLKNKM